MGETDTAYNAGEIAALEKELVGTVDMERLIKAPQWTRLLVNDLVKRIANLRREREWQPIEAAPRDSSDLLLYDPDNGAASRIQIGMWNDIWTEPGWQSHMENETLVRPTHWQPLPEPPND